MEQYQVDKRVDNNKSNDEDGDENDEDNRGESEDEGYEYPSSGQELLRYYRHDEQLVWIK